MIGKQRSIPGRMIALPTWAYYQYSLLRDKSDWKPARRTPPPTTTPAINKARRRLVQLAAAWFMRIPEAPGIQVQIWKRATLEKNQVKRLENWKAAQINWWTMKRIEQRYRKYITESPNPGGCIKELEKCKAAKYLENGPRKMQTSEISWERIATGLQTKTKPDLNCE